MPDTNVSSSSASGSSTAVSGISVSNVKNAPLSTVAAGLNLAAAAAAQLASNPSLVPQNATQWVSFGLTTAVSMFLALSRAGS